MEEPHVPQPVPRRQQGSPLPLDAQVQQLPRELCRRPEYRRGALPPDEVTRRLHVTKGTPLPLRRHTVFDPGSRPVEFREGH